MIMVVDMKVIYTLTCLTRLSTWELVVDDTMDGKDNLEEKTREVADIQMYHYGWNFLQLGSEMLCWRWLTSFFLLSASVTTWTRVLMVGDTVDGKDN